MDQWESNIKALADETRRGILSLLLTHDFCVGALARRMGISEAAISQHLRILRETGLVTGEKRGYYTHYRVNRDLIKKTAGDLQNWASRQPDHEGNCLYKKEDRER